MDDFPSASNEWMTPAKQIQAIQSWPLKPDFIINLKVIICNIFKYTLNLYLILHYDLIANVIFFQIPDQDLYDRRLNLRVDPVTNEIFVKEVYDPQRLIDDNLDAEEGSVEEEEEELDEEESTISGAMIEEDVC